MENDLVIDDLDAAATLAAVEGELVTRRAAEARDLALAAHWADLHAADPWGGHGTARRWCGQDRLIEVGGEGTPRVQELCLAELAVARRVHHHAARRLVADALDLRHRLPSWWAAVQATAIEPWLARKVATLSRELDLQAAAVVDDCLPADLAEISPARIIEIVTAKVIEADPVAHAAKLAEEQHRRYVRLSQTDEFGLRHLIARVRAGDAVWLDAMVDRVADLLAPRFPHGTPREELRSEAFGWLARPADLLDLLTGGTGHGPAAARPRVVLYIHLHQAAVGADHGVARVEDLGPILSQQLPAWLGHAHLTVTPVVDLADQIAVDAYEHPHRLTERVHLRSPADCFPHANQVTRRLDHDHVEPYAAERPGQTGDHNVAPLSRPAHRAKTHAGHHARQLGPGSYAWRTPHGLYRLVDHRGTTVLTEDVGAGLLSEDPTDNALAQMRLHLDATGIARVPIGA